MTVMRSICFAPASADIVPSVLYPDGPPVLAKDEFIAQQLSNVFKNKWSTSTRGTMLDAQKCNRVVDPPIRSLAGGSMRQIFSEGQD